MGNRLREARQEVGMSQDKLSKLSGVSRQTISKIEQNDNVNINMSTVVKICEALNTDPDLIFFQ